MHEEEELELRKGLRRSTALALSLAEQCPTRLKPEAEDHLRKAIATAKNLNRASITELPTFAEDHRRMHRDRTRSVRAQAMQTWLASADGKQWREERHHLFSVEGGQVDED